MDRPDLIKFSGLLSVSVINALIQTLGLVSIMPFIALISEPSIIESQEQIIFIKSFFNLTNYQDTLIFFACFSFASLLLSNAFIIINYWISLWVFNGLGLKLSTRLLNTYLHNPPHSFYKESSAKLSKRIFSDVDRAIVGTLLAYTSIFTDIIILCVICALLIFINPLVTAITILALIISYILVYMMIAKKIDGLGHRFLADEDSIHSIVRQSLTFYKEIRVSSKQDFFLTKYHTTAEKLYKGSTQFHTLKFIPVQIVELLVFSIILSLAGYLSITHSNTGITITTISIYAFSAYRLVPILKSIFDSTEEILYTRPIFTPLLSELITSNKLDLKDNQQITDSKLYFRKSLTLNNITYRYPGNKVATLCDVQLSIKPKILTCIIGKSGIGKSTLLDIILGIQQPTNGQIVVDGITLNTQNLKLWQNNIGYVPQKIHLLEDSIVKNIAFAESENNIDLEKVKKAAKAACLDAMIEQQLESGYNTIIGEGGKILSGGEIQRIGIARALYKQPQTIIFDEATNALDSETESNILSNLKSYFDASIIFVTHKQSVINQASEIINLNNYKIKKAS